MRRCAARRFAPAGCRRPALHGRLSNQGRPASSAWQAAPGRIEIELADRPSCRRLPAEAAHSLRHRQAERRPRQASRGRRLRGGRKLRLPHAGLRKGVPDGPRRIRHACGGGPRRGPGASAPEGARRGDAGMPACRPATSRTRTGHLQARRQAGAGPDQRARSPACRLRHARLARPQGARRDA